MRQQMRRREVIESEDGWDFLVSGKDGRMVLFVEHSPTVTVML